MGTILELFVLFLSASLLLGSPACLEAGGRGITGRYSREFLLSLRTSTSGIIPDTIPGALQYKPPAPRLRKRGKRGGLRRRLKTFRLDNRRKLPPLPTILLSNVQSIRNKTDELELWTKTRGEIRDSCLLAFTESWLTGQDRDEDLSISGFGSPIRLDRSSETTGKSRGGGVCFYINERYCNIITVREKICTADIELLSISLRPFYLPREFQQLFYTLVYIHPRANAAAAAQLIADTTHKLDEICPDAPKFILGDFNHCDLSRTMRTYEQYVTCATTQKMTSIDLCYGSVGGAYSSVPMPSLGASYHNSVYLVPVYKPSFRRVEHEERTVKVWSEDSISSLQACFECTDWECFQEGCDNIDELTDIVSSYVTFCEDMVIPTKTTVSFPNNKPWVTKELKSVINKKKRTFYTGDIWEIKAVSKEVKNEIRKAKIKYKRKVEEQYSGGDLRAAWRGIKSMASLNQQAERRVPISVQGVESCDLPDAFNLFYSRFESSDFSDNISMLKNTLVPNNDIMIPQEQVTSLFKKVNIRKAAGPDAVSGRTLRFCADQLSGVFTCLFNMCAKEGHIPHIWKSSTIIPLAKLSKPKELKDFRPVALTSLVMKIFEKILKAEVMSLVTGKLDPLQFAYQTGRSVDDAKLFILDTAYKHLEKPGSHVRLLFADFSSAFNKMQPHILIERLANDFQLSNQLLLLLLNFLTDRIQRVFVNGQLSQPISSNTGSPQGCVLSPLLFILYTDSCRTSQQGSHLVKFSDDTALLSLFQGPHSSHGLALTSFVKWCDDNFLDLNVAKTKELIIDFRKAKAEPIASVIHGGDVEIVDSYKYLGTIFDSELKFHINTETIVKKGQQRIHLLRKLNSFSVSKTILRNFYQSFIESLLTFSFLCWFNSLSVKDKNSLSSIVNTSSKIIGTQLNSLSALFNKQAVQKAKSITSQPDHVLSGEFSLMPSGRRYYSVRTKTKRYSGSFIPTTIRLLNKVVGIEFITDHLIY